MTDKNYIYKKLSDGRYIKEIDNKVEHLATAQEDSKLATDIRSLLQGPQGLDGTSGTSGQDGTSGKDGQKGDIGRTGLTGPRGLNGTSGTSGSSGQDGTSGQNGQDGTSGINGRKGDKGDKGDRGFPGLQGPSGQSGSAGVSGTSGTSAPGITSGTSGSDGTSGTSGVNGENGQSSSYFLYRAKTNTYTGNPDNHHILWNNATQTGATAIHINHLTDNNLDIDIFLGLIRQGSNLIIQHQTNSGEYQTWDVNATPTLVSGANNYWIVPVTLVNSTISFTNNTDIFVAISADSGTSGSSGTSGVNGTSGTSALSIFYSSTSQGATVSNTTGELVTFQQLIPAGTFKTGDVFEVYSLGGWANTSYSRTLRVNGSTQSATLGGSLAAGNTRLGQGTPGSSRVLGLNRVFFIYNQTGSGEGTMTYPTGPNSETGLTNAIGGQPTSFAIDWTKNYHINIGLQHSNILDSGRGATFYIRRIN